MLPLQGEQVQTLIGELRYQIPRSMAKKNAFLVYVCGYANISTYIIKIQN